MLLNEFLFQPENAAGYVLLSNIYAAAGNRRLCANVWMAEKGQRCEETGCTSIEVKNEVHSAFVVDD